MTFNPKTQGTQKGKKLKSFGQQAYYRKKLRCRLKIIGQLWVNTARARMHLHTYVYVENRSK